MFLGIDIGTSSAKAVLIDSKGKLRAEASASYPLHSPRPGWNEQNPEDWWIATKKITRALLRKCPKAKSQITAIGFSGQMHGSVFLDVQGKIIRPALLWNDQRTEAECQEIEDRAGGRDQLLAMVQNPALTGYTAPKLLWLRNHEPTSYRRLRHLLLPKDFVRYRMTGELAIDVTNASGTLLLDIKAREWSKTLIPRLEIDERILPPVLESSEAAGRLTAQAARELGLPAGVLVVAGAGDQPAGAVGMGIVETGKASATLGTSGVVFAHADQPVPNPEGVLQSFAHAIPEKFCAFGCMLTAGGALEWLRQTLFPSKTSFNAIVRQAEKASTGCRGLVFLPYLDGERCPYPDPQARGAWIGLSRLHGLADLSRAVFEGVTYGMAQQIELLRQKGLHLEELRLGGGGAKSKFWRQLQADVYDKPVLIPPTEDVGAFGAALLAGVGAGPQNGGWASVQEACKKTIKIQAVVKPRKKEAALHRPRLAAFAKLYPALQDHFKSTP